MHKSILAYMLALCALALCIACSREKTKAREATEAAIATAHPLATDIGAEILRNGGNAVDAAVGVHFALAVCLPRAGNISGGGFAVLHFDDQSYNLDFREMAPMNAYKGMYLDSLGNVIPGASLEGPYSSGIPGSVAGMQALHDSLGSLPWSQLIQPAIDLAINGVVLDKQRTQYLNVYAERIRKWNPNGCSYIFPSEGGEWSVGDTLFHPELAKVLMEIRDHGSDGFYRGWVADSMLAESYQNGGIWSEEDLNSYVVKWREPIAFNFKGKSILCMAPPSSSGIALYQLFYSAEKLNLSDYPIGSFEYTHLSTELMNRVYAIRSGSMGDPDWFDVPYDRLMNNEFLDSVFSDISFEHKTSAEELGKYSGNWNESSETTHFSIVDADGNAVSLTTTLNGNYGSKSVVDGCGFFLNNEMDDFSAKPGVPNQFGLIGYEANSIQAKKRMLSSMSPTIVLDGNEVIAVTGSPGGSRIITMTFQTLMYALEYGLNAQEAVDHKRMHSQWQPDYIRVEEQFLNSDVQEMLEEIGHEVQILHPLSAGKMELILLTGSGLSAASDTSRVQGKAMVLELQK